MSPTCTSVRSSGAADDPVLLPLTVAAAMLASLTLVTAASATLPVVTARLRIFAVVTASLAIVVAQLPAGLVTSPVNAGRSEQATEPADTVTQSGSAAGPWLCRNWPAPPGPRATHPLTLRKSRLPCVEENARSSSAECDDAVGSA